MMDLDISANFVNIHETRFNTAIISAAARPETETKEA